MLSESHLLKGDAVVWNDSEHACQQVLDLRGDMAWCVVHPLYDLLTQLLHKSMTLRA